MDTNNSDKPTTSTFIWGAFDQKFATLYRPEDLVPDAPSRERHIRRLAALEDVIVDFEACMVHSDCCFALWRRRHQRAIEYGLERITLRSLSPLATQPCYRWYDRLWFEHYAQLVHNRENMVARRLRSMGFTEQQVDEIFAEGTHCRRGSTFGRHRLPNGQGLRNSSCDSVDVLLERFANRTKQNAEELRHGFWTEAGLAELQKRKQHLPRTRRIKVSSPNRSIARQ
jgi:hypothetical protein